MGAAADMEGVSEVDAILAVVVVDPSATSATGLVTLLESAGRKRTAATSATALGTLRGTAARMKTPATTAMRWVTSWRTAPMRGRRLATSAEVLVISRGSAP